MTTAYNEIKMSCFHNIGNTRKDSLYTRDTNMADVKSLGKEAIADLVSGGKHIRKAAQQYARGPSRLSAIKSAASAIKGAYLVAVGNVRGVAAAAAAAALAVGDQRSADLLLEAAEILSALENCVDTQARLIALEAAEVLLLQAQERLRNNSEAHPYSVKVVKNSLEDITAEKLTIYFNETDLFDRPETFRDDRGPVDKQIKHLDAPSPDDNDKIYYA